MEGNNAKIPEKKRKERKRNLMRNSRLISEKAVALGVPRR